MISCSPKNRRAGTASVTTIAKPEKIAPATKQGGNMVVCHPAASDGKVETHHECTLSTSGVASAIAEDINFMAMPVPADPRSSAKIP